MTDITDEMRTEATGAEPRFVTAQDAREREPQPDWAYGAFTEVYESNDTRAWRAEDWHRAGFLAGEKRQQREDGRRIAALVAAVRLIIADVVADPYTTPDISVLQSAIARWSELDTNDK